MRKGKKIISVLLVLCMLFTTMLTIYASEYETYLKVSDELLQELNVSYEDLLLGNYEDTGETYSCIIWIEDVQIEEAVEAGIDAAEQTRDTYSASTTYAYNYETTESDVATLVDVTLDDEESDEYVQTYIEAERKAAKEMYASSNSQFVAENFMARDMSVTYVSQYTPCIFADLSITKIAELIWESDVVWIGYEETIEADDASDITLLGMTAVDLQTALSCMRVNDAKTSLGLTGTGIKIGQIERCCPEISTVYLNEDYANFLALGEATDHPERVYSIMSKIAPNATYYATGMYSNNTATATKGNFYEQIEWLLNQGVNIINMSMGFYGIDGNNLFNKYTDMAQWLEHITYNHDVHMVFASGNEGGTTVGENGVASPGMAYNIITVGNCDWVKPYTVQSTSSYNFEGIGISAYRTYKPDIVAPASSTSYAAPMVTGIIALMCEQQPSLKTKQPIVKSILAASAGPNTKRLVTTDANFKQYGAGMIDAWAATYVIAHGKYTPTTGVLHSSNTTQTYSMNVGADDSKMRVALSYTNYVHFGTVTDHVNNSPSINGTIADVTIFVFDPNGNLVASCPVNTSTIGANLKVIEFETGGVTGTYTIHVYMRESASGGRSTNIGVAWW